VCACRSTSPGTTSLPAALITRCARSTGMFASTASTRPLRRPTSRTAFRRCAGSSTWPPLMTRSNLSFGPIAARTAAGSAAIVAAAAKRIIHSRRVIVWFMLFLPLQRYDFAMATLNPPAAERNLVGTLVMAALVLVLAWQLAYWTWNFLAPASASAPATGHGDPIDLAVAARLFGGTASPSGSSSGLRLKGVVAP